MLDALNDYISFLTDEIEIYDNFPNELEKEIAVGKRAEAIAIRNAFAIAATAAERAQEAEMAKEAAPEVIKSEPIGNGRVMRLVRDGNWYNIETVELSGGGAFQIGCAMTEKRGLEKFAKMKQAMEVKEDCA